VLTDQLDEYSGTRIPRPALAGPIEPVFGLRSSSALSALPECSLPTCRLAKQLMWRCGDKLITAACTNPNFDHDICLYGHR
jgi:hypothetical protein